MSKPEIDEVTGAETTGHEWDGIKELNIPAPRWWLWVFFICVIYSVGYWIVYPAWPTLSGHTKGIWNWTQFSQLKEETSEIEAIRAKMANKISKLSLEEIRNDTEASAYAFAGGRTLFRENCSACHGSGAEGGKGFPNLNDDDWLWGGDLNSIYTSIKYGIRSNHVKSKDSAMPSFQGIIKPNEIEEIAKYIEAITAKRPPSAAGEKLYLDNCGTCHGETAKGNKEIGAPNIADKISLYGASKNEIISQILGPRHGVMPYWEGRLSEETIRYLTIYVHSLGGGEMPAQK